MGVCVLCRNRKGRFFQFPKDKFRRNLWLAKCKLDSVTQFSKLCEAHFDESQFQLLRLDGWKRLKSDAVPTLLLQMDMKRKTRMSKKNLKPAHLTVVFKRKPGCRKKSTTDREEQKKSKEVHVLEFQRSQSDCGVQSLDANNKTETSQLESKNQLPLDDTARLQKDMWGNEANSKKDYDEVEVKEEEEEIVYKNLTDNIETTPGRSPSMLTSCRTGQVSECTLPIITGVMQCKGAHPGPVDFNLYIALLWEQIQLTVKEVQSMECKCRDESKNYEVLVNSLQMLQTENMALQNQSMLIEQELAIFNKKYSERNNVINELKKQNAAFLVKVSELEEEAKDPRILQKLKESIKELESEKLIFFQQYLPMLEEVNSFMTKNRILDDYSWDLEKRLDKNETEYEEIEEKYVDMSLEKRELNIQIENMSGEITYLKHEEEYFENIQEKSLQRQKLRTEKIAELEEKLKNCKSVEEINISHTKEILELEIEMENLKKSYSTILKNSNILECMSDQKFSAEEIKIVEATLDDLKQIIED